MIPTFVIVIGILLLVFFFEWLIKKLFYKEYKLPPYVKKEETTFIDGKYTQKKIFEVPGCGKFDTYEDALEGSKHCAKGEKPYTKKDL